jgi:hypothetical protein
MQSTPQELDHLRVSSDQHRSLIHPGEPLSEQLGSSMEGLVNGAPHKHSRLRWASRQWMPEILSWVASLCFFIATVVTLWVFDNRPLPNLRFGITPNAIIGLLATFVEFFLIIPVSSAIGQIKWIQALESQPMDDFRAFDEASRGPWGSLLLLVRRRGG